ncbi:MAG: hypothetical protein Q8Q13_00040 [bacterium]|nr:hypothetical protein [bacterium]
MKVVRIRLLGIVSVMTLPAIASAAGGAVGTYGDLVNLLVSLMNNAVAVLIALALAVYFYGMSSNIIQFGSEENIEKKKAFFFWGVIILFVMVSIWGILRIVQNTFFPGESLPGIETQRTA